MKNSTFQIFCSKIFFPFLARSQIHLFRKLIFTQYFEYICLVSCVVNSTKECFFDNFYFGCQDISRLEQPDPPIANSHVILWNIGHFVVYRYFNKKGRFIIAIHLPYILNLSFFILVSFFSYIQIPRWKNRVISFGMEQNIYFFLIVHIDGGSVKWNTLMLLKLYYFKILPRHKTIS